VLVELVVLEVDVVDVEVVLVDVLDVVGAAVTVVDMLDVELVVLVLDVDVVDVELVLVDVDVVLVELVELVVLVVEVEVDVEAVFVVVVEVVVVDVVELVVIWVTSITDVPTRLPRLLRKIVTLSLSAPRFRNWYPTRMRSVAAPSAQEIPGKVHVFSPRVFRSCSSSAEKCCSATFPRESIRESTTSQRSR
jgi:hypothetical protein